MRKKIPLIGGILNLIEALKGNIGIIENGDTATHAITSGSYVIWKNELYKASSAIAVDDALSASNLTAVSGGGLNELNEKNIYAISLSSGWSSNTYEVVKIGRVCIIQFNGLQRTSTASGWTTVGTVDSNVTPSGRILGYLSCDSELSAGKTTIAECRINTDKTLEIYAPQSNIKYWGGFVYFCD